MNEPTFVVLAKQPQPGRVKTRLSPPFTPAKAADLAAAALLDTLDAVSVLPARERTLAFDGDATGWLRPGWTLQAQVAGGLDARIAAALAASVGPAVLVGMDTPQLSARHFDGLDLNRYDACFGPAADGGYWTLGLSHPEFAAEALLGIPMSEPNTGQYQLRRLRELGLRVQMLPELTDVDTAASAAEVAAEAPNTRFGRLFRDLEPAVRR